MYGCTHSSGPSQDDLDAANDATAAAEEQAKTNADATDAAVAAKVEADAAAEVARMAQEEADAAAEVARLAREAAEAQSALDAQAKIDADAAAAKADEDARIAREAADAAELVADAAIKAQMDAEAERDAAQDEADRLQGEVDTDAAAKASDDAKELLNMALRNRMDTADDTDDDSTAEGLIQDRKPSPTLKVSNDGMLTAKAKIATTDTAAAIVYTMADMAPDTIEGWRGATLTNAGGDTAVVYSDIGNDGTKSLLDRYVSNLPTTDSARSWNVGTGDAAPLLYIQWSSVERPDDETSFAGPDGSAMLTFMGSVHDIDGMFSCAVAAIEDCGAPARYSDDSVETGTIAENAAAGEWTFVPNEGAELYTDDKDYLVFGWWLDKGEDGKPRLRPPHHQR